MNTEANQENSTKMTAGQRLRQAREQLGLSHQMVAERLCLKVSTIRQIEEESTPTDLAPTFLRGYIRSYAKLVHVSDDELSAMIGKQSPINVPKVASMQGFSLGKSRKKRDGWLMAFTWLIVLVVLGLPGAWWWQNHQAQQAEIVNMADQSAAQLNQNTTQGQAIPLNGDSVSPSTPAANNVQTSVSTSGSSDEQVAIAAPLNVAPQEPVAPTQTAADTPVQHQTPAETSTSPSTSAPSGLPMGAAQSTSNNTTSDSSVVAITFKARCWIQIDDASGKTLFSGLKQGGDSLNLKGQAPYKLKIGAPAAIDIQYQGKQVDLSRFLKSSRVAHVTLAAE